MFKIPKVDLGPYGDGYLQMGDGEPTKKHHGNLAKRSTVDGNQKSGINSPVEGQVVEIPLFPGF